MAEDKTVQLSRDIWMSWAMDGGADSCDLRSWWPDQCMANVYSLADLRVAW